MAMRWHWVPFSDLPMNKRNIGIVGVGKWGKNYLKLANKCDVEFKVGNRNSWKELNNISGVVIATPPDSHVEIAKHFLEQDIPVMIEKPLCLSVEEAEQLSRYKTPILVNYLHLFSPAFEEIVSRCKNEKIVEIESVGSGNGPVRNYSALYDYGSHDLSMSLFLSNSVPQVIYANNSYQVELQYPGYKHCFRVNNNSGIKCRTFSVALENGDKMTYDDMCENKLVVNDQIVEVDKTSTLENSFKHFLAGDIDQRFGIELSINVIKVMKEIDEMALGAGF